MVRSVACGRWCLHVNGVNPTREMRDWLTDNASLTVKLTARSKHFRVHRLRQERGLCLADESEIVELARRRNVQEREVLLQCDGRPMVYAHTIVPLTATTADWPFFSTLGERSLGTTLFGDPRVRQGRLQYARLRAQHPLVRRASTALGGELFAAPLFARRCLYRRRNGVLLVTELFLPAIAELNAVTCRTY
jgi:chorismate lyase